MAEEKSWFDSLVEGADKLGSAAGNIYNSFSSDDDSERAYLQGQVAAMQQQQNREYDAGIVKIGSMEISTSSSMWIIGGTVGRLVVGALAKKLL